MCVPLGATNRARIARHQQSIGETRLQLLTMREELQEQVAEELSVVRTDLAAVRTQLPSREDVLTRTVITAPLAGTVMNVRVTTTTGRNRARRASARPRAQGRAAGDRCPGQADGHGHGARRPSRPGAVSGLWPAQSAARSSAGCGRSRLTGSPTSAPASAYFLAKVEVEPAELKRAGAGNRVEPRHADRCHDPHRGADPLDYLIRPFVESITKSFRER